MPFLAYTEPRMHNPVDVVETLATSNDWLFDRNDEHEITLSVEGSWTRYDVALTWLHDVEALHLAAAFDQRIPAHRHSSVVALLAKINENLLIGHFDLNFEEGVVVFRQALMLAGGVEASPRQCESLLKIALAACEKYFPAFQWVIWGGESAEQALEAVMFETKGRA